MIQRLFARVLAKWVLAPGIAVAHGRPGDQAVAMARPWPPWAPVASHDGALVIIVVPDASQGRARPPQSWPGRRIAWARLSECGVAANEKAWRLARERVLLRLIAIVNLCRVFALFPARRLRLPRRCRCRVRFVSSDLAVAGRENAAKTRQRQGCDHA